MYQLLEILTTRASAVPSIKEARLFNGQIQKMQDEKQGRFPMVFVEVINGTYEAGLDQYQWANCTVRLHVVNKSPKQGEENDIYVIADEVHQYFHNYTNGQISPLVRTKFELDRNHSNMYDYKIDYVTRFTDITYPLDEQTVLLQRIKLLTEMLKEAEAQTSYIPDITGQ